MGKGNSLNGTTEAAAAVVAAAAGADSMLFGLEREGRSAALLRTATATWSDSEGTELASRGEAAKGPREAIGAGKGALEEGEEEAHSGAATMATKSTMTTAITTRGSGASGRSSWAAGAAVCHRERVVRGGTAAAAAALAATRMPSRASRGHGARGCHPGRWSVLGRGEEVFSLERARPGRLELCPTPIESG